MDWKGGMLEETEKWLGSAGEDGGDKFEGEQGLGDTGQGEV